MERTWQFTSDGSLMDDIQDCEFSPPDEDGDVLVSGEGRSNYVPFAALKEFVERHDIVGRDWSQEKKEAWERFMHWKGGA